MGGKAAIEALVLFSLGVIAGSLIPPIYREEESVSNARIRMLERENEELRQQAIRRQRELDSLRSRPRMSQPLAPAP